MGYTHYWGRKEEEIKREDFEKIAVDFFKISLRIRFDGIELKGIHGKGEPLVNGNLIAFNGDESTGGDYEPFYFPRVEEDFALCEVYGEYDFQFCKTNLRPYDLAVMTFLIIAKHHLGDFLHIASDGDFMDDDWSRADHMCQDELGYGLSF